MKISFETEVCSRCGGTGEHLYNEKDGKTCFKCIGLGKVLTKTASKSKKLYEEKIMEVYGRVATDLKVGDVVMYEDVMIRKKYWMTIMDIDTKGNSRCINGVWQPSITFHFNSGKYGRVSYGCELTSEFRIKFVEGGEDIMREFSKKLKGCTIN